MREAPPKVFVGYSDITALHEAFATRLGVVTVHGPLVGYQAFSTARPAPERLRATLFEPETGLTLTCDTAARAGARHGPRRDRWAAASACSPRTWAPPPPGPAPAGGIVVLEDLEEEPYRLDRMLTQLLRAGWFDDVAGIALGSWVGLRAVRGRPRAVLDRLGPLGVPIVWELGFGHGSPR